MSKTSFIAGTVFGLVVGGIAGAILTNRGIEATARKFVKAGADALRKYSPDERKISDNSNLWEQVKASTERGGRHPRKSIQMDWTENLTPEAKSAHEKFMKIVKDHGLHAVDLGEQIQPEHEDDTDKTALFVSKAEARRAGGNIQNDAESFRKDTHDVITDLAHKAGDILSDPKVQDTIAHAGGAFLQALKDRRKK